MEKPWPNEAYHQESPYSRFRQQQGLEQRQERSPPPLAQSTQLRLPNLNDWSSEQEAIWREKDPVEVERYYLNTHLNIKKMKKSPRGKPTCLIRKKKEWRNGLANILASTVEGWQPTHTTRTVPLSVATASGISSVKKEIVTGIGMPKVTQKVPSFKISSPSEEGENEDKLLL